MAGTIFCLNDQDQILYFMIDTSDKKKKATRPPPSLHRHSPSCTVTLPTVPATAVTAASQEIAIPSTRLSPYRPLLPTLYPPHRLCVSSQEIRIPLNPNSIGIEL